MATYPQSIEELCEIFPQYVPIYDSRVRHYILRDHTNIVLDQFDKYFSNSFHYKERELIRFFLILHDIGKPKAFEEGNTGKQYDYSKEIIGDIWFQISGSNEDLKKVLFLLEGDYLGEYFQNKRDLKSLSGVILNGSINLKTSPIKFLNLLLIYYQCDTAAYTQDAGGSKYLEHLFHYKNGTKLFDKEEGLLRLSPIYREKYLKLKNEIIKIYSQVG